MYRIAPDDNEPDLLPPAVPADILGPQAMTLAELTRRLADGARFALATVRAGSDVELAGEPDLAFVVGSNGAMRAATDNSNLIARDGDTLVTLVRSRTTPAPR